MITINTVPNALHPGYNDIEFGVKSTRNSRKVLTITGVTDSSGFCRFATSTDPTAAPGIQVGDTILGSGFSTSLFNNLMTVTAVDTTWIETDLGFIANETGVLTRRNDNFKIKGTLIRKSSVWAAAVRTDVGGFYAFTSAIISEDTLSVGDYLIYRTSATKLHKITSISGTTAITSTVALTATITNVTMCLCSISGVMYAQPDTISEDAEVFFNVRNLVNVNFEANLYSFGSTNIQSATNQEEFQVFGVLFEELYEDKNGLYQIPTTGSTIAEIYDALNAVNQVPEGLVLTPYIMSVATPGKFLTDIPSATISIDEEKQLSFITALETVYLTYRKTALNGTVGSWSQLALVTLKAVGYAYYRGAAIINKLNILDASTKSVEIKIQSAASADISTVITLNIDQKKYDTNRVLYFRNRRGGIDSYNYSVINETTLDLEKEYSRNSQTKSTSLVRGSKVLELESRYETKEMFEWLEQLYESKDVYMYDASYSTKFVRVNIIDSSHILNSKELFSSIIEVELQEPLRA